ncbi:MAG: energy transducer TonB [Pseudomonadota bacterium]|nr:energy transducer TonB [Pseudomonadota bacterium]
MKTVVLTAVLLTACLPVLAATPSDTGAGAAASIYTYALELAPDGSIQSLSPMQPIEDSTRQELDRHIQGWIFQPAQIDGVPVATSTYLRVGAAIPANSPGDLQILSATTGPAPEQLRMPDYPVRAQRRGEQGVVVLELRLDETGRVVDRSVYDRGDRVARDLMEAATAASRDWRFYPEKIDGTAVASTVLMPVCFISGEPDPSTCTWRGPSEKNFSRKTVLTIDPAARVITGLAYEGN